MGPAGQVQEKPDHTAHNSFHVSCYDNTLVNNISINTVAGLSIMNRTYCWQLIVIILTIFTSLMYSASMATLISSLSVI